jgi:NADH-quinone oxidoreductase subunit F
MIEINQISAQEKIRVWKVDGFEGVVTPLLLKKDPSLKSYIESGGYKALEKALSMNPDQIIEEVKKSGLRGRGGAGFSTGIKWSFIPKEAPRKFLVCNADEGEPATFKDRYIITLVPHLLLEGMMISGYAIGTRELFIYIRGEYWYEAEILKRAIEEATEFVKSKFNFDVSIKLMQGAGAYIVGEETALLNSLEGKRGHPRPRPPYPAQKGYLGYPTCVNNVETLSYVPFIIDRGADWFKSIGTEKSTGPKLFCISGNVKRPGLYELPMGFPLKKFIELAGGTDCGKSIKAVIPGGTSAPPLTPDEVEKATLDFESIASFGAFLGTASVVVICECQNIARVGRIMAKFYAEESCGQCTTCREGTRFIEYLFEKIENGHATELDIQTLKDVSSYLPGSAICAHVDAGSLPAKKIAFSFTEEIYRQIKNKKGKIV